MRALLALAALSVLVQPAATVPTPTIVAQSNECTGPNCPPKHDCEKDEKTVS